MRSAIDSSSEVTRELSRLTRVWSEASMEVLVGGSRLIGDLMVDVVDSFLGAATRYSGGDDYYDEDDYDDDQGEAESR